MVKNESALRDVLMAPSRPPIADLTERDAVPFVARVELV